MSSPPAGSCVISLPGVRWADATIDGVSSEIEIERTTSADSFAPWPRRPVTSWPSTARNSAARQRDEMKRLAASAIMESSSGGGDGRS